MDLGLQGRRALVGGASAGIGRAIAAALVDEGAEVAISSRTPERIEATAREIGARPLVWDSEDLDGAADLVARAEEVLGGPLDVLVTNTGGPPRGDDPLGFSREQWEAAHRTLVLSPLALVETVMPGMRERGFGRIVNVGSSTVREPIGGLMLSNSERSGLLAAFKTIARDVAADGVTLNTVLPGRILTDRLRSGGGDPAAGVPAGRAGEPEELGALAAFLCSAKASYITGTAIAVDGGLLRST